MSATTGGELSTLARIRTKVRRLTASPSPAQLTDSQIDDQVNNFYFFDLPEELRLWNLREEYNFYTDPNVDAYPFPRNEYINMYQPVYIGGYQSFYSQSREQFFRIYPQLEFSEDVSTGDGVTTEYTFNVSNTPVMRAYQYLPDATIFSRFFVSYTDASGVSVIARDNGVGGFIDEAGTTALTGSIDYETGTITALTFLAAPPSGATIVAQYVAYQASRPQALLYYSSTMFLRPIPDKAYKVAFDVLKQPTFLLQNDSNPALQEWWQILSFGAAKRVLEERQDMTSLANIMPMYKAEEAKILRRTTQQLAQERTATIFTDQCQFPWGNFNSRF
jgi:hypothetical protein